jgi:hypothetical protein
MITQVFSKASEIMTNEWNTTADNIAKSIQTSHLPVNRQKEKGKVN